MDKNQMLQMLQAVQAGELSPQQVLEKMHAQPFEDLGYAKVDYHRGIRQGVGEVIYGAGKTAEQIVGILKNMCENGLKDILVTRINEDVAQKIQEQVPMQYHALPKLGIVNRDEQKPLIGSVVVAAAGTSDLYASEEAAITAELFGNKVTRLYDVGVAGLHRLLSNMDILCSARVVVAVAGMEGALASVVGGLVSCPVIAVPTSVGYGASFGGVAALLSMLNSCASGVSVVNIDNGFGAGYLASTINKMEGVV